MGIFFNKRKKKQTTSGVYRVLPNEADRTWVIKRDGATRIIASFATKDEALARVKELAENQDVGFTVRKKDGKFQKKNCY